MTQPLAHDATSGHTTATTVAVRHEESRALWAESETIRRDAISSILQRVLDTSGPEGALFLITFQ